MVSPNIRFLIFLAIVIGGPVLWGIAEFKWSPRARRICGVLALLSTFALAAMIGLLANLEANTFFSKHSKRLISESVKQLEAGRTDAVLREWKRLDEKYRASYEHRAYYQELIDLAIDGMNTSRLSE